ncbi:MAG: glycoside hydrolase family 5 protein [Sphingobium sp.]
MRCTALSLAALPLAACMQAEAETASRSGPTAYGYTLKPAAKPRAGIALPLGKCINMGGMMERPNEGDLGRPIRESDFRIIRDGGFRTVRLPIVFSAHTRDEPPYTIDPAYMARVKRMADAGLDAGLNVMIDVHAYREMMDDPEGETARFTAIWRQIAETFKDAPKGLWFELLNEPTNRLWNKVSVWTVYRPALAAIRKTNPTRPVIVAGNLGSRVDSLASLQMPDDPYLVPTVHMYDPKEFTHQGAKWTINRYARGRAFLNTDRAVINERVAAVKAYMDRTGRVPFLGEYGAIDDASIKPAERVKYYGTVSAAFASIGVQNCAWSYVNGFNLYKNGAWVPGMLKAIQTTTTIAPK